MGLKIIQLFSHVYTGYHSRSQHATLGGPDENLPILFDLKY